ncbi:Prophage integrase IntA [Methylophilaceae bacterium]|nr:Prophage integrase IntA [Methylophilaceae bacterium]
MKLTDTAVRKAKPNITPAGKVTDKPYKMADGGGLYLQVQPGGGKWWRLKYRFGGKEKLLALGVYPDVTLADARARRDEARKVLANGGDPGAVKQTQKKQARVAAANSFELIARELHALKSPIWSQSHADDWIKTLQREIFPRLGERPIAEIEAPDVLEAIRAIEGRGAYEIAARALQRVRAVCAYAIATGRARHNPAVEIKGALAPQPKVRHFAALTEKELPDFLRAVAAYPAYPLTKAATRLLMLTFVRTGEVRGAKWCEFDCDAGLWVIPAERMKAREPHTVPLSRQALAVLAELRPLTGHGEHLFPGRNREGSIISENTVLKVIERLGYKGRMTGHGFRSIASTYLNGVGMIRPDVIEAQLAHADGNATRAAYNRADYMEYRRAMMQFWADTLDAMQLANKLPRWPDYEPHGLDYRAAQVIPLRA